MDVQPDDLTAKARIRRAALELFAQGGAAATSMRSITARSKVSPSLVVHHYGTKARLRDAVDEAVVASFATALRSLDTSSDPATVADQVEGSITRIIGGDHHLRQYLARALFEPGPAGHRLFDALLDLLEQGLEDLEQRGHLNPDIDPTWRAYTTAFVILGPVMLSRHIEARLGLDPFAPHVVQTRSSCNMDVLSRGLFRGPRRPLNDG